MGSETLEMKFETSGGTDVQISLADPKDGITRAEVAAVMQSIIDNDALVTKYGAVTGIVAIQIRTVSVETVA